MWPSNTEDVPHKSGDVLGDVCKWPTTEYTSRGTYSVNLPIFYILHLISLWWFVCSTSLLNCIVLKWYDWFTLVHIYIYIYIWTLVFNDVSVLCISVHCTRTEHVVYSMIASQHCGEARGLVRFCFLCV